MLLYTLTYNPYAVILILSWGSPPLGYTGLCSPQDIIIHLVLPFLELPWLRVGLFLGLLIFVASVVFVLE